MQAQRGSLSVGTNRLLLTAIAVAMLIGACAPPTPPAYATPYAGPGEVVKGPSNPTDFAPDDAPSDHSPVSEAGAEVEVDFRGTLETLGPDGLLWYQHVMTLANPYFEGRVNGTDGGLRAREYIQWWFQKYGLEPAFPTEDSGSDLVSYRQPFEFSTGASMRVTIERGEMSFNGADLIADEQFTVLGNSGTGEVTAPITFVGYGIEDGRDGYTSFDADTDLTGRIALLLRYEPLNEKGVSQWANERFSRAAGVGNKINAVIDRGAAGVILVNPPNCRDGRTGLEPLDRSRRFGRDLSVPIVQITPVTAESMLATLDGDRTFYQLRRLADNAEVTTLDFSDDHTVSLATDVRWKSSSAGVSAANVGGVLRGRGALRDEWVVIGGHHDHNGYGWFGTKPEDGPLFPGADDNASGTSGVLVLAKTLSEYYAETEEVDLRSILFMTFDAEERGLYGSAHFADNPSIEPSRINAMLNMDMIGRLRSNNLSVLGTSTAEGLEARLDPYFKSSGMRIAATPAGSGRSDDANFAKLNIPALHFFTGMHPEYTTPDDHGWTVNPAGAVKVIALMHDIAIDFATTPDRLVFSAPGRTQGEDRGYAKVRLGVRPGMNELATGILVESVSANTSAADGGIIDGDVMLTWNTEELVDLAALMEHLGEHKPGDVVVIRVRRGEEELDLNVTLKASSE
jgi:hypothetical protein